MLLPEVEARRALADRSIRLRLLVPYGTWIGRGTLRVLRLKMSFDSAQDDNVVELVVGYESYRLA